MTNVSIKTTNVDSYVFTRMIKWNVIFCMHEESSHRSNIFLNYHTKIIKEIGIQGFRWL